VIAVGNDWEVMWVVVVVVVVVVVRYVVDVQTRGSLLSGVAQLLSTQFSRSPVR
jgi:hypothetical protein